MSPTNANSRRSGPTAAFTLVEVVVSVGLSAIILTGILAGYTFLGRNFTRLLNTRDQDAKSRSAFRVFSHDISGAIQVSAATTTPAGTTLTLVLPASAGSTTASSSPAGIRAGLIEAFTTNTLRNASAGWTSNLVNPAAPWLVRITSGPSAGKLLAITANTATSLTVSGADLATLGLTAGTDTFELATTVTYTYLPPPSDNPASGKLTRTDCTGPVDLLTNLTTLGFNYFNKAGGSITSSITSSPITSSPLSVKEVELTFASALGNSADGTQSLHTAASPRLVLRNKALLQ